MDFLTNAKGIRPLNMIKGYNYELFEYICRPLAVWKDLKFFMTYQLDRALFLFMNRLKYN